MTRLTEANIQFVKRHEVNGKFRRYYVALKGGVSQGREYFLEGDLPKAARDFIGKRRVETFYEDELNDEMHVFYIWRK